MTPETIEFIIEGVKYIIAALISGGGASLLTWRAGTAEATKIRAEAELTMTNARRIAQEADTNLKRYQDERHNTINERLVGIHEEYQELIANLSTTLDRKESVIQNQSDQLQKANVLNDQLRESMSQAAITDREQISAVLKKMEGFGDDIEALLDMVKDNET